MAVSPSTSHAWYPKADSYWVDPGQADEYPFRYGDVFSTPDHPGCVTSKGQRWSHVIILHPSCEINAKLADDTAVLVARVNRVESLSKRQHAVVRVGWREENLVTKVAHGNTFWLPPLPSQEDDIDWYADFRRLVSVNLKSLVESGREACMTHDARAYLIRREVYFKYRWNMTIDDAREFERQRIAGDPNFVGPKPSWA